MRSGVFLACVVMALVLVVAGCWDRVEIEDIAWVQAIGFDKGPEEFLTTTMEIGIPRGLRGAGGGAGGGEGGPHYTTITIVSKTALEALDLVALNLGRRVSLEHTQVFVFGEDLAKGDLRGLVGSMSRFRQVRGAALCSVARGRAEDILRVNTSPLEVSPSRFIQTILQQHAHTGLFKSARFIGDFVIGLESSSQDPVAPVIAVARDYVERSAKAGMGGEGGSKDPAAEFPSSPKVQERVSLEDLPPGLISPEGGTTEALAGQLPKTGGGSVTIMGTAVFSGGVLAGYLTGEETRALLMVQGDFERGAFAIPDPQKPDEPKYSLGADVRGGKTRVRAVRNGEAVTLLVETDVDISYLSMKTQADYTDPRYAPLAESAVAGYLKEVMDRAVQNAQALGADPFGFGNKVRRTFTTWPEFEAFAWKTKFASTKVEIKVNVHLRRYGMEFGPLNVPPSERLKSSP